MEPTTYHCNRCITPLFRNQINFHDARANILIINQEAALNIRKVNNNIIQCETCKENIGRHEETYNTYIINKNKVVSITIIVEELN